MRRIRQLLLWAWRIDSRPVTTLSLGFLTLGGFLGGVLFWGAFNTALELTNTETFCISCHAMKANVYEELTRTTIGREHIRTPVPNAHIVSRLLLEKKTTQ